MRAYIARRLLIALPTLLLATIVVFVLTELMPGDIIDAMRAAAGGDTELDRAALEKSLGLDAPLYIAYGRFLGVVPQVDGDFRGLLQGNLGTSWYQKEPVAKLIAGRWPVTLELGLLGMSLLRV